MADLFDEMKGSLGTLSDEQIDELISRLDIEKAGRNKATRKGLVVEGDTVVSCPHCGSVSIKKHGHKDGIQRYRCKEKECGKTFTANTGTVFGHSKLSQGQWRLLIQGIVNNLSTQKIANDVGVSAFTVWYNKQKILEILSNDLNVSDKFVGIVQCDEKYFRNSFKGKKGPNFFIETLHRMPRHHRTRYEKEEYLSKHGLLERLETYPKWLDELLSTYGYAPGISDDQTCVLTCQDMSNHLYVNPICLGRPGTKHIQAHLKGKFVSDAVLVTDSHNAYPVFANSEQIHLEQIPAGKHASGPFNLALINALHAQIEGYWSDTRRLPATKYLDLHLALVIWLERHKDQSTQSKVELLLSHINENYTGFNYERSIHRALPLDTKGIIPNQV